MAVGWWLLAVGCWLLVSCGVDGERFRLEGRLRNINQGEFWVYSPEGAIVGIDTIRVRNGRFSYETDLRMPATFVIIFPNYSEQPVFGEPGKKVTIKGDASHLKEMTIKGTEDNEDMTKLRMELNRLMPPEVPKVVADYIKEHPASRVSIYLLQRYFLLDGRPDYRQAYDLTKLMLKEQPEEGQLIKWNKELEGLAASTLNGQLPSFSATDVKGRSVSQADLKAKVNILTVWASWNFQSMDIQRRLMRLKKTYGNDLGVLSICLDGRPADCRQRVERDSVKWKTVCDGRMWQSPLLARLGVGEIPANLVINQNGKIIDSNLSPQKLEEKIDQLLKP